MADCRRFMLNGSFDPFTLGHLDLVDRALNLCDELYILVMGHAVTKNRAEFSEEDRVQMIRQALINLDADKQSKVVVKAYSGLAVDAYREFDIRAVVRGVRDSQDLAYETQMAQVNYDLDPDYETIMLLTKPQLRHVSSSLVRELLAWKSTEYLQYVPEMNRGIIDRHYRQKEIERRND